MNHAINASNNTHNSNESFLSAGFQSSASCTHSRTASNQSSSLRVQNPASNQQKLAQMSRLHSFASSSTVAIEAMAIIPSFTSGMASQEIGIGNITNDDIEESRPLLMTSEHCSDLNARQTPIPARIMTVLCFVIFCEPVSLTILFPFIYFMVRDFGISGEKDVGFYVGFIASAFSLAQFMTSLLWGWVSDRVGRRPVLLIGLLGNAISLLLFGQAHSLQMAIFSRFLCGILNGNIGIAKCVIGEITDSTNQAFGFSLIGIMWSVGTILGPIMGGCLANPVQQFPWLFGGNEFLTRNPYFLPCGVSAVVSLIGFVIGFFFMEETNGKLARATAVGMRLATEEESPCGDFNITSDAQCGGQSEARKNGASPEASGARDSVDTIVESVDGQAGGSSREGSTSCLEIEDSVPQQDPCQTDSSIEPSAAKFGKAALMSIMAYALLAFQNIILDEVFSLWIVTGSEDGGLGYNSAEVGIVLSIIGALALYMQLITYPQLTRKYAPISLFRTGAVLYLVPYLSYPILSGYLNKTIENKTTIWILLICNLALRQFCNVITYTSIFILINNSASPGNLGLINGIAQTSAAFVRSIGPALGGIMWAWSINNGLGFPFNYWFVFLVVSAWGVGLILQSCFIPVVEGFEGGIGEAGFTGGSH